MGIILYTDREGNVSAIDNSTKFTYKVEFRENDVVIHAAVLFPHASHSVPFEVYMNRQPSIVITDVIE